MFYHYSHRYYRTIVHRTLCRSDRKSSIIFTLSSLKASAFGGDRRFRADWMEAISRAGLQSAGSAGHKSHHRAETRSTIWRHGGLLYEQLPRLSISARCAGNTADSPPLILHFVCQPSEFRARWGPLRRARRACQPPALALPTGRGAPRGLRTVRLLPPGGRLDQTGTPRSQLLSPAWQGACTECYLDCHQMKCSLRFRLNIQ